MTSPTLHILGYAVDARGLAPCADEIVHWIATGDHCRWLACLNPHSYAVSLTDRPFSDALREADWLLADGVGVVLASRFLRSTTPERVTGGDVVAEIHKQLDAAGTYSVFFLGSTDETLALIRKRLETDFPHIRLAGTYSPPFRPAYTSEDDDLMVAAINAAAPDVLWVGLTAPKQEKWIARNRHRLRVRFAGAVGAVFEFYAGRIPRAHPLVRQLGLEWLIRLVREPRRLWRRMFVSAPIFLWRVLLAKLSSRESAGSGA
jgi:N-acetylglucosaminyldiphosphoundecaprenol N-acetyl-beta-D-mannosaminyltransferase